MRELKTLKHGKHIPQGRSTPLWIKCKRVDGYAELLAALDEENDQ